MNKKQTGKSISTKASKVLTSNKSSAIQKKLAGSAHYLNQTPRNKQAKKWKQ